MVVEYNLTETLAIGGKRAGKDINVVVKTTYCVSLVRNIWVGFSFFWSERREEFDARYHQAPRTQQRQNQILTKPDLQFFFLHEIWETGKPRSSTTQTHNVAHQ